MPSSRPLGELLVQRKVLSRDVLEEALVEEEISEAALTQILLSRSLVRERDLMAALAEQSGIGFWDPQTMLPAPMVFGMIPAPVAVKYKAAAVEARDSQLVVAMADPTDREAVGELAQSTGWPVIPILGASSDLDRFLAETYGKETLAAAGGDAEEEMPPPAEELHLNSLLEEMVKLGASDLHLSVGRPPCVRIDGVITALEGYEVLNGSDIRQLVYGILTQRQREKFEAEMELDTSHAVPGSGRFRLNVFLQKDAVGAVLRAIPFKIVPLQQLGLPATVGDLGKLPRGLVLVTGPTGSGKSTTLASVVDIVNSSRACHIMTVEDPIEFLHEHKKAVINQREVGEDTRSFAEALKRVLRQDPDVILVGEMRDLETIASALTAAETGHLVFGTLHTQDAPQAVDRIIDVFPSHQQQQIRVQLASSLQAVVTQQLLPKARTRGRVVAAEVMIATPAIRNLIREGKVHQIYSSMQAGGKYGMQTMDQSLALLVRKGLITPEMAFEHCHNEEDVRRMAAGTN